MFSITLFKKRKDIKMTTESNLGLNHSGKYPKLVKEDGQPFISRLLPIFLWVIFAGNLGYMIVDFGSIPEWFIGKALRINGFSILMWTTVSFFSAIICSYAGNYLKGFKFHARFMVLCLSFTLSVMLLVISNHILLIVLSWLLMGLIMSRLIGIDRSWSEAGEALKFTQKYFLTGSFFLALGLSILAFYTGEHAMNELMLVVDELPMYVLLPSALCIIAAAIVQSAMYPFHRWLLSAMTAPTPASALMHAGFVNGAGILLALFSSLIVASNTLTVLFVIGGFTAIIAQFTKLLQVNVKQKLACSTIAQMGFMIMQCGLGFFNAAVVHLLLHGFYKAYLFLSSGEEIAQTKPYKPVQLDITPLQALAVLLFGGLGAYFFVFLTGKNMMLNSSVFLTLIVAITIGQATYNIVKERSLSMMHKILVPTLLFVTGIGTYALLYSGVTTLMSDFPMAEQPIPLTWVQLIFGVIFLIGFFVMKLGVYKKIPWLYVKLMNISQPNKKTILMYQSKSI